MFNFIQKTSKNSNQEDLCIGYKNFKPVIIDNSLTRTHFLIYGKNYPICLNAILKNLLQSKNGMIYLENFQKININNIFKITEKIQPAHKILFFSFSKGYNTPPKIPLEVITSGEEEKNEIYKFLEKIFNEKNNSKKIKLKDYKTLLNQWNQEFIKLKVYKMLSNEQNQKLLNTDIFSITKKFLELKELPENTIFEYLKNDNRDTQKLLKNTQKTIKRIKKYIHIFKEKEIAYSKEDLYYQEWEDLFFQNKSFFDTKEKGSNVILKIYVEILNRNFKNKKPIQKMDVIYPLDEIKKIETIQTFSAIARALSIRVFYTTQEEDLSNLRKKAVPALIGSNIKIKTNHDESYDLTVMQETTHNISSDRNLLSFIKPIKIT